MMKSLPHYPEEIEYKLYGMSFQPSRWNRWIGVFFSFEQQIRMQARASLEAFIEHYNLFAEQVLDLLVTSAPEFRNVTERMLSAARRELNQALIGIRARTQSDLDKVNVLCESLIVYMSAAKYLDEKEEMLGYVVEELVRTLQDLGLLKTSRQEEDWILCMGSPPNTVGEKARPGGVLRAAFILPTLEVPDEAQSASRLSCSPIGA